MRMSPTYDWRQWCSEIESEVRLTARMKAKEFQMPFHEHGEFEAYCVEKLSGRAATGKSKIGKPGVARAVGNLAIDWERRRRRVKPTVRIEEERVDDVVTTPLPILAVVFETHPLLACVAVCLDAGMSPSQVARAIGKTEQEMAEVVESQTSEVRRWQECANR